MDLKKNIIKYNFIFNLDLIPKQYLLLYIFNVIKLNVILLIIKNYIA
jgi:hypothetical protein